jgi:hypothetical protein
MDPREREPGSDIGAVFDEHVAAEFVHLDIERTMSTMTADPYVNHVPVMTGGVGLEDVRRFYGQHFIGKWPADTKIAPVSRAHLLGSGVAPRASGAARSTWASSHRAGAGGEPA